MSNRCCQCESLACVRLDSRYSISLFDSNHFIGDTSPLFCSHGNSFPCACSISADSNIIGYFSDCLDRLATARERTSSNNKLQNSLHQDKHHNDIIFEMVSVQLSTEAYHRPTQEAIMPMVEPRIGLSYRLAYAMLCKLCVYEIATRQTL